MCAHIFMAAQADPTIMLGGTLPLLGAGHRVGHGDTIILESCEYCDSFLSFLPTVAVVLNIEADHLDYFKDLADVEKSFRAFAELVPEHGFVVANAEDENTMHALSRLSMLTFGIEHGDVTCGNLVWEHSLPRFDVMVKGEHYAHVALPVPGAHNLKNALAAAAAAWTLGIPGEAVSEGLAQFRGAGRRFEYKGSVNGVPVYDDYAHHPGELTALLGAVRPMGYKRVLCAFQPHTYSRTKALFEEFVQALSLADVALLTDIYAARETDTLGVSSAQLAERIPGALYCPTLPELTQTLREMARPGDLILTVGAGNIYTAGEALVD